MKNYTLKEEKYLEQEQTTALVYEHNKTKAKILVMKNTDDNKVFGIGFRTPPLDSTGVCHILEHCVLNGSKKYRTREPFMDMVKGSLQTFLNAMTYPDKTLYPIASRNNKDFENLMDLYLDAVFNPRVLEEEKIFRQEGWRYHVEGEKLSYKGVVYNEMKGALSSPEDQVFENIDKFLFPNSIYSYNSGGDPYEIPNLSYEDFLNYYKDFYHPSNSYIFLYGDLDHEKYLSYIHNEYLGNYDFKDVASSIEEQIRFSKPQKSICYFNTSDDIKENSNYLSYSVLTSSNKNIYESTLSDIVNSYLLSNDSSLLKKNLLDLDVTEDILNASSSNLENSFSLIAKNIRLEDIDKFIETIELSLKEISEKGIDKDLLKSVLNELTFDLKEKSGYPTKGIVYFTKAFSTWLYDLSPIEALDYQEPLKEIKKNIDKGIIEKFIEEKILNNPHKSIVIHKAKKDLNLSKDEKIKNDLNKYWSSLSQEERNSLIEFNKEIEIFQNRQDTDEEKATIPVLSLRDINADIRPIHRALEDFGNYKILKHKLPTSGIDYITLAFDISHLNNEEVQYLSLLCQLSGMIDTENYKYGDLSTKIYLETGGISMSINQLKLIKTGEIKRKLYVTTKSFSENSKNALEILEEIMFRTKYDNLKRLKDLLQIISSRMDMSLFDSGHIIMLNRALSHHLEYYAYNELIGGIDYLFFIKNLLSEDLSKTAEKLQDLSKKIYTRKNLIVNIGSDLTFEDELNKNLNFLINKIENKEYEIYDCVFIPKPIKEGFSSSADVQYIAKASCLNSYDPKITILNNLLSNTYLYSEIRAKGGAYGAGLTSSRINNIGLYSYRDPNLLRTLDVYKNIGEYLEKVSISEKDLLPFIIGAAGKFDPPMSELQKSTFDLSLYITGKSYGDINKDILSLTETSLGDLKAFAPELKKLNEDFSISILGSKKLIEENKEVFDLIINI